ncbi:MAG: METTL5 family protein [Nanoarchaeota archaeon]|nr:METTL5 family protein [Nanoarchaeota archaeon]
MNKKQLAIKLSKLKKFEDLKLKLEQYSLDSEIAAEILWRMYLNGDVKDKIIGDFGCGNGILGYGCLLLNAKKVYFIDKDTIDLAKENVKSKKAIFVNKDIKDFNKKVDVVVQNPPFGTKIRKADKVFLEKAMQLSDKIYSLHKITSKKFIQSLNKEFTIKDILDIKLPLKKTYKFHRKKVYYVDCGLWVMERFKKR